MKKIGIYNPYMHILGGGERYVLNIAQCMAKTYHVDVFWNDPRILKQAGSKFNLDLGGVHTKRWFGTRLSRAKQLRAYEAFFYVTDGSLFASAAKKNFLIVQSPDKIPHQQNIITGIKLKTWQHIVCYSQFMADIIQEKLGKAADVLFVPIDPAELIPLRKKKMILSVGRFFPNIHTKKQSVLIDAFRVFAQTHKDWQLVLVGSVDPGAGEYVAKLKRAAAGHNVRIITDASFAKLQKLYGAASIYWHAAGFGEDLQKHPERAEHFGVSTIEAMAAGAIPVVFAGGGQTEIVSEAKNGFLWHSEEELLQKTQQIIKNPGSSKAIRTRSIRRAKQYTTTRFCMQLYEMVAA